MKYESDTQDPRKYTMWRVCDLVLVTSSHADETHKRLVGVVVDVTLEKTSYWGESYIYHTLVQGEILRIGDDPYLKIARRITETSEEFWGKLKK